MKYIYKIIQVLLIISILTSSCYTTSELFNPHFGDGIITKVTEREVTTINYLNYEIPHRISRNDSSIYTVGDTLIFNR